jgi:muramoyltetrapeptide carboxypeptidase
MKNNISPPFLEAGDTIGICCPAGAVDAAKMEAMYRQIRQWGFELKIGKNVGKSYFKFSATDKERLEEVQDLLDDENVKAIFFARGGYGAVRIIDQLDFTSFNKKPKWLVGYSDITCFHSHLHTNFQTITLHAHMGSAYIREKQDVPSTQSIYDALTGVPHHYKAKPHSLQRTGQATGQIVGGNLALLSDLVGTKSDLDTNGKILFIEDISEYRYNIDRMMWQLLRAGKLDELAGLIVGSFNDTQDNEIPFGITEQEIVHEKVKKFKYPVCFDFPVGHQAQNLALKIGSHYKLIVEKNGVILREKAVSA